MPEAQTEVKARPDVVIVTPENYNQLLNKEIGIPDESDPEVVAAKELKEVETKQAEVKAKEEAEKKDEEDPTHDATELHEDKKKGINERFAKVSAARREAEEKAAKAIEEAKALKEEREQLAKERDELKAKYEPVKTEQDPEPQPEQFNDVKEYAKALKEWTADNTKREEAKRIESETVAKKQQEKANNWKSRWEAAEKSIPDMKETVAKADGLMISNEAQQALMDSEVGPEIVYFLAKNPSEVEKMNGMTIDKMLKFIGKLEDKVTPSAQSSNQNQQTAPKVEISKAPAPISPLKGGTSVGSNKLDENGEFHGTYDEWKALRKSGKIK